MVDMTNTVDTVEKSETAATRRGRTTRVHVPDRAGIPAPAGVSALRRARYGN